PMPNLGSPSGKWDWVEHHIPELKKHTIITNVDKGTFAGHYRVLIDDKDENVNSFTTAGGRGILCPRPWNSGGGHDTVARIEMVLERICG
ncbi:hypothetical protein LCGC14_2458100, partial [marine sediment metagenome]